MYPQLAGHTHCQIGITRLVCGCGDGMRLPESVSLNNKSIRFLPDTLPGESWERSGERGSLCICLPPGGRGPWHSFIEREREGQLYEAIHHRINGAAAQNSHPRSRWMEVGGAVRHGGLALLLTLWSFTPAREKAVGKVISLPLHRGPLFKRCSINKAVGHLLG